MYLMQTTRNDLFVRSKTPAYDQTGSILVKFISVGVTGTAKNTRKKMADSAMEKLSIAMI